MPPFGDPFPCGILSIPLLLEFNVLFPLFCLQRFNPGGEVFEPIADRFPPEPFVPDLRFELRPFVLSRVLRHFKGPDPGLSFGPLFLDPLAGSGPVLTLPCEFGNARLQFGAHRTRLQ